VYAVPISAGHLGKSEEIIGRWLKDRNCRDEFVIATKVRFSSVLGDIII
jgi:aryl-alcohol dehydrogenase-like predicted oxidoreductase